MKSNEFFVVGDNTTRKGDVMSSTLHVLVFDCLSLPKNVRACIHRFAV